MTGGKATKHIVETIAKVIFLVCAAVAIVAVLSITVYMFAKGTPALAKVGVIDLLFGTVWQPTAATPSYGILYIILTSIVGTAVAILIGVPIGILTAVFITEVANKKLAAIVQPAVELLAAIPSVIYGLLGLMVLNPLMYRLEKRVFAGSTIHQFTGGSNLLSAIIVLAIMILPTVINISVSSIRAVPGHLKSASLALGATHIQTIFKVMIPAARSGIMTGVVLGIGGYGDQYGCRRFRKSAVSIQFGTFPDDTDRQRDELCRRTSPGGTLYGRSGIVYLYYDYQSGPCAGRKERSR